MRRQVLASDPGTPRMIEIAKAIQEGAAAYLKRQFKTIGVVIVPLAVLVFLTATKVVNPATGHTVLGLRALRPLPDARLPRGCGPVGLRRLHRHDHGGPGQRAHRCRRPSRVACQRRLQVAFRAGGTTGLFAVGLGLLGATAIVMLFQNTATAILIGFGFGGSLLALFLRVGGGIFTKAADVGADLVGKVEAGIPEDDPRNPATIADNVGDNVGDCAGMAADLFEIVRRDPGRRDHPGRSAPSVRSAPQPRLGPHLPAGRHGASGVLASIVGIFSVRATRARPLGHGADQPGLHRWRSRPRPRSAAFFVAAVLRPQPEGAGRRDRRRRGPRPGRQPDHRVLHLHRDRAGAGDRRVGTDRPGHHVLSGISSGPRVVGRGAPAIAIAIAIGVAIALGGGNIQFSLLPRRPHRHRHAGHHRHRSWPRTPSAPSPTTPPASPR